MAGKTETDLVRQAAERAVNKYFNKQKLREDEKPQEKTGEKPASVGLPPVGSGKAAAELAVEEIMDLATEASDEEDEQA